jgi:hypothetical protein
MYWLTHFGTTALPQYDAAFSIGPAPADVATVGLIGGGVFDAYGTGVARQRFPLQMRYACSVVNPSESAARAEINALKALIGTRAKLWRTEAGAAIPGRQWCWARLFDVNDSMLAKMTMWSVPVAMSFTILGPWKGLQHRAPWTFDAGFYFDEGLAFDSDELTVLTSNPQTVVVDNNGNMPVRDPVIWVTTRDVVPITSLTIAIAGETEFVYTGSLAENKRLVIDCENKSVTNDGVGDWQHLNLTGNHYIADWLVLQPGNNNVVVTRTGGSSLSTIEFRYSDGWA